jgi:hypothetical protein
VSTRTWHSPPARPPQGGLHGIDTPAVGVDVATWPAPRVLRVGVDPARIPPGTKLRVWPNPWGRRELVFTAFDAGQPGQQLVFYDQHGHRRELPPPGLVDLLVERIS